MKRILFSLCSLYLLASVHASTESYRGQFTPDAEYVLSGKLAADLPPLPQVPFNFDAPGYRDDLLSDAPKVGIHPRVVLSPADIEEIKANIAKGDAADTIFKVCFRELRNKAAKDKPMRDNYGNAPWGGIGIIAAKGLLAELTDDQALGREAAEWTVKHARFLEGRIHHLNTHPDAKNFKDNFYYFSRSEVRVGGVDYATAYREGGAARVEELAKQSVEFVSQDHQWSYTSLGAEYDYAYNFMTEEERDYVRSIISAATHGKYTTGMEIPGHFFINNHMSMGAEFYTLLLSIEGEEGFDERAAEQCVPRLMDKLTYDISADGILYENVKGFIPIYPIYAAGKRGERNHLKHDHLMSLFVAKAYASENIHNRYFNRGRDRAGLRLPEVGKGAEDPRFWILGADSGPGGHAAFVWGWVLKRLYPENELIDYCYKIGLQTSNFDLYDGSDDETRYDGKVHYNTRNLIDLMLLCATDGARDDDGAVIDYQKAGIPQAVTDKGLAWKDMHRGIARIRSGWEKDDMVISYECRSDVYYGGHETPEQGDFRMSSHGVLWSPYTGAYMDSYFRNMVLVDGYAGVYQPTPGKMMEVANTDEAATIVSDATEAYQWKKMEKNFYMWHGMLGQNDAFTDWLRGMGFRMNRDFELPFQPHMKEFYNGFAHLDWGPWHGETRGTEYYERWNDMEYVYRTMHMARGENPYLLIVDDLKKDDQPHQYDWNYALPGDVALYSANSVAKNRNLEKGTEGSIGTDLIFCLGDTKQKRTKASIFGGSLPHIGYEPQKGDPMLLVRVLWRNTSFPYPLPSFEQAWKFNRIKIPAYAVDPEFRVLIYPHRFGEALPFTKWNDDRSQLLVSFDGQDDVYTFNRGEDQRTVFSMARNDQPIITSVGRPQAPELDIAYGHTPNRNLALEQQDDRRLIFADTMSVAFVAPSAGAEIRYTVDGSEPTEESALYTGAIELTASATVKALTLHKGWMSDKNHSTITSIDCVKTAPLESVMVTADQVPGLSCEVFSEYHTIFENDGFFTGYKNMIPDLDACSAKVKVHTDGFVVPPLRSDSPTSEMEKGYYRYRGFFNAAETGTYGFKIFSTGPLKLSVGGRSVIEVVKPYGLSQKDRFGEVVLAQGMHELELVVCDPVFWKGEMEPLMPLELSLMTPSGSAYLPIEGKLLSRAGSLQLDTLDEVETSGKGELVNVSGLKPGLIEEKYDWSSRVSRDTVSYLARLAQYEIPPDGLAQSFFEGYEKEEPFQRNTVWGLPSNDSLTCLIRFEGYFSANTEGYYRFQTDGTGGNQLSIGGQLVAANRIAKLEPLDKVYLVPGTYRLEYLSALGNGEIKVMEPNSSVFKTAVPGQLLRDAELGSRGTPLKPIAIIDFEKIEGDAVTVESDHGITGTIYGGTPVDSPKGKGLSFSGAGAKLELSGFKFPDYGCTVAMWMKRGKSGDSYPLRGLPEKFLIRFRSADAIWASFYRSPEVLMINGGDPVKNKEWFHLAVSYGEKVRIFLNGKLVQTKIVDPSGIYPGSGPYAETITIMDGEEGGAVDELYIYNRMLTEAEVQEIMNR